MIRQCIEPGAWSSLVTVIEIGSLEGMVSSHCC